MNTDDRFYSYDGCEYETHATAEAACGAVEKALANYRDASADDGWSEDVTNSKGLAWGEIRGAVVCTMRTTLEECVAAGDEDKVATLVAHKWQYFEEWDLVAITDPDEPAQTRAEMLQLNVDLIAERDALLLRLGALREILASIRDRAHAGRLAPAGLSRLALADIEAVITALKS